MGIAIEKELNSKYGKDSWEFTISEHVEGGR